MGSVPAIPGPQSPLDPQHRTGTTTLHMGLRWHQVPQAFLLSLHITAHGCPRCQLALEGPFRALEPAGAASEAVRPRQQLPRGITSFHQDTLESPSPHTDQICGPRWAHSYAFSTVEKRIIPSNSFTPGTVRNKVPYEQGQFNITAGRR